MELMVQMVIMVMVMMVELVFFAGHEITRYLISIFREDIRWYFYAKWREAVLGLIQISNKQGGQPYANKMRAILPTSNIWFVYHANLPN